MPAHLDHMREHVLHGTTMNSNNIAVDRSVSMSPSVRVLEKKPFRMKISKQYQELLS